MKLSKSFVKTLRNAPKDETAKNAQLLIRAGFVHKEVAGVYTYLPLGLRVLENIKNIIREEINAIDGQEISMTALQNPEPWKKTDRYSDDVMDVWFKTKLNAGGELGLAPTHEEPITAMLTEYINSYKDLPVAVYQFQTKFRNELRAKSGIMRGREFLMKDLYSFSPDAETHEAYYHRVEDAYAKIFDRLGLGDCTYKTFASGGAFSKFSHEYQTVLPVGEDTIYYNEDKSIVLNEEVVIPEVLEEFGVKKEDLQTTTASEVGNIFTLKDKYSKPLGLVFNDKDGKRQTVYMGCYGIGVSRVMGVIVEKFADDKGLVWPENIAPYKYYIIGIGEKGEEIAKEIHDMDPEAVLLDDRKARPGEKFADAELMGIPYRVVISDKTLDEGKVEFATRSTGKSQMLTLEEFKSKLIKR